MPPAKASPTAERLLELIDAMRDRPVVLAADLVLDRFITGSPKRISREAPVLILRFEEERLVPGGGANAVANVHALGGRALPLGVVGDDVEGTALRGLLADRGVDTRGIAVRPGYRTPTKTRILGGGPIKQQIVRYDVEDHLAPDAGDERVFDAALAAWDVGARVAVLSDYGYGSIEPDFVPPLRAALGDGATILCDSRYRLRDFAGVDGATPNLEEAEAMTGESLADDAAIERAGRAAAARLGLSMLLVTRGSRGMSLVTEGGVAHLPVHGTDQVADVTGAGDTVIGAFALALAAGASALEAALLADYAGGVVVMKMGTATLTRDELAAAVRSDPRPLQEVSWARS